MGTLLHSRVKVCEPIELSFGVVSGVGIAIRVLDGFMCPKGKDWLLGIFRPHWFEWRIF